MNEQKTWLILRKNLALKLQKHPKNLVPRRSLFRSFSKQCNIEPRAGNSHIKITDQKK